jgi:hypothetical protein
MNESGDGLDIILHLPKGTRTREQCIELLNHPRTVDKCNAAKARKKEKRRVARCTAHNEFEASIKASGRHRRQAVQGRCPLLRPAHDVNRRSEARIEYNAQRAFFNFLLGNPPTINLPPPSIEGVFRKGGEALAWQFTLGQLLPAVDLTYTETAADRYPETACTWAGKLSHWERDYDIRFALSEDSDYATFWQLQCKGTGSWFRPLYRTIASTDYQRSTSQPFLVFHRFFRRMAHFAIRHLVNELQNDYQSEGDYLPILYLSYAALKRWLHDNLQLDTSQELFHLYCAETVSFWNRFEELFSFVFPQQWSLLLQARDRARKRCAMLRKHWVRLTARDVTQHFADCIGEVKEESSYPLPDRERIRARFNELVGEVNRRYKRIDSHMSREQALDHILPYNLIQQKNLKTLAR